MSQLSKLTPIRKPLISNGASKSLALTFGTLAMVVLIAFVASAWTEPSVNPPNPDPNISTPLNIGSTGQSKAGGLILNTAGAPNGLIVQNGNVGIGTGTTSPGQKLTVAGTIESTSGGFKFPNGDVQVMAASGIPSGAIIMWAGTLATIPSGWQLCDGTGSTPDLRAKFIYGTLAGENPGATGGNTVSNWPRLWKQTSQDAQPGWNVSGSVSVNMTNLKFPYDRTSTAENTFTANGTERLEGSAYTDYAGGGGGPNTRYFKQWERLLVDNNFLPPFYKLAFICKL